MKSHDELVKLSDEEKLAYLNEEVEKVIQGVPPHKQLKLRALQARINTMRKQIKNEIVLRERIFAMLIESAQELADSWKLLK